MAENIPFVDFEALQEFYEKHPDYVSSEVRGAKNRRAMRHEYSSDAVGWVQLRRLDGVCTVVAMVTPEHKVTSTPYTVEVAVKESEEDGTEILHCQCKDCAASKGSCKHGLALISWLMKTSSQPSVTSTQCY
ncbi:Variant SH3 domain [Nesidiocoris tenuis]|uniref:Variant SH3 domain n=1 Tax=Nesidiocoris tenuis TaxID=355587 RepID=A0ABN7BGP6_9HEMI|nr:Variant SH3 domain [Nesidiocoris tenuis]